MLSHSLPHQMDFAQKSFFLALLTTRHDLTTGPRSSVGHLFLQTLLRLYCSFNLPYCVCSPKCRTVLIQCCVFVCRNILSTVTLGCCLDLDFIASKAWNVEYKPKVRKGSRKRHGLYTVRPLPTLVWATIGRFCLHSALT